MDRPNEANDKYPNVRRIAPGICGKCGQESNYCVRVVWRNPWGWSRPEMCCAGCRVRNQTKWAVATGWHDGVIEEFDDRLRREQWEQWCRENPPYTDEELAAIEKGG